MSARHALYYDPEFGLIIKRMEQGKPEPSPPEEHHPEHSLRTWVTHWRRRMVGGSDLGSSGNFRTGKGSLQPRSKESISPEQAVRSPLMRVGEHTFPISREAYKGIRSDSLPQRIESLLEIKRDLDERSRELWKKRMRLEEGDNLTTHQKDELASLVKQIEAITIARGMVRGDVRGTREQLRRERRRGLARWVLESPIAG